MSRLLIGFPGKNAPVWRSPLASQSPRRSPHCRVHSASSRTPKTRRLRHNTNNNHTRAPHQRAQLPLHCLCLVRRNHNRLNLPPPDRLKITNRLLISKPHRPCCRGYSNPNTLRLYRGSYSYNRPRPDILRPILPSKY